MKHFKWVTTSFLSVTMFTLSLTAGAYPNQHGHEVPRPMAQAHEHPEASVEVVERHEGARGPGRHHHPDRRGRYFHEGKYYPFFYKGDYYNFFNGGQYYRYFYRGSYYNYLYQGHYYRHCKKVPGHWSRGHWSPPAMICR